MTFGDRLLDLFSPDHQYRDEVKKWQRTGQFPDPVMRWYKSGRVQGKDVRRMQALGYRVVKREEAYIAAISGDSPGFGGPATSGGIPRGWKITYTRTQFEQVSES
jgi:hypothetical protein